MKILAFITTAVVLVISQPSLAGNLAINNLFTPEVVEDTDNSGKKGAVQLVWQKTQTQTVYEVEVDNGTSVYRTQVDRNFHHIMIYFGQDYKWRVRDSQLIGAEFSEWRPVKVLSTRNLASMAAKNQSKARKTPKAKLNRSPEPGVDEYHFDQGD